ncbi:MAG: phosphoglucosamine mutase [Candidatus Latescibacterota bacterium]|nr:phosphoglucosamine mutase [Candidatus Latescibacterota bacterium]MED5414711.1 phosphoglucosamine mutase [Candidatus Latescibacterota bacterium]MEE3041350.1 phosphoglucosamine mutase [Candidatus Latescibacterota bacterium]MEE3262230.1 phosphoglucosamine mutase [Candidatus Latescibacterota bacterium]
MSDAPLIVSVSGIRGIVGASLTHETVRRFTDAFATWLPEHARVVLARDTRPSGEEFADDVSSALRAAGCHVIDLGLCATPVAKLMVLETQAQGALILTASHNPAPWNGLKLIRDDGIFLNARDGALVEEAYHQQQQRTSATEGGSESIDADRVRDIYFDRLLAAVDVDLIRDARLRAAIDPCNGTGGLYAHQLLEALGVEAHLIHDEPNGDFAHDPEPTPENLVDLGRAVTSAQCHIGFAIDPDADRVALVGENGEPLGEDLTLALAVQSVTARRRGPVVTTLSTSQIVSDAAAVNGCPVLLTPVGEVNVVDAMVAEGAVIGGEGNGGVILTEVDPGRDAALGIALVLETMARSRQPLARIVGRLPQYTIEKRKVSDVDDDDLQRAIRQLIEHYPGAERHPVEDGVKLYIEGGRKCPWIHLRPSNTEPVVRIIAESASADQARQLCDLAAKGLQG